jgi:hypothetical protein
MDEELQMSNRVRILFRDFKGTVHCGNRALKTLEKFYFLSKFPVEYEWVTNLADLKGKPPRKKRANLDGSVSYQVLKEAPPGQQPPVTEPLPVDMPKPLRARWYYEHLAEPYRGILLVTREDRQSHWRHSPCNPLKHGWAFTVKPKPQKSVPGSIAELTAAMLGNEGYPFEPATTVVGVASEITPSAGLWGSGYYGYAASPYAGGGAGAPAGAKKKKKTKNPPKTVGDVIFGHSEDPDDEFHDPTGDEPPESVSGSPGENANNKDTKKKPERKKYQIGVWQ